MYQHECTPGRYHSGLGGWRLEPEALGRDGWPLLPDELLDDPDYHDGWSPIRRRPVAMRKEAQTCS